MEIWVLFAAALLLACLSGLQVRIERTQRKIARVERQLDLVLGHLGIQEEQSWQPQVGALLREGRKIEAIKVYRQVTGASLLEAKEAVERME
ncbi:hypothetical protein ACGFS9_10450 [Streptomyces sp. NPDC048566]|uniref:hypothetical protein n=1 Tax=Streptomyces sp. NPDC048566 TaxID=3365569 RepID=UPI003714A5FC